ncbi:MAG TPA: hypothetical protein VFC07_04010 [Verrucomicrobiae bacterium]|nr:hypothetical protein [Verrucomicrobiae bacterium]
MKLGMGSSLSGGTSTGANEIRATARVGGNNKGLPRHPMSGQSKALRAAEVVADFGGGWGIAKKVFFEAAKSMVFLQILQSGGKHAFWPMKTGMAWIEHFSFLVPNGSKTGPKKISCQSYRRLQI